MKLQKMTDEAHQKLKPAVVRIFTSEERAAWAVANPGALISDSNLEKRSNFSAKRKATWRGIDQYLVATKGQSLRGGGAHVCEEAGRFCAEQTADCFPKQRGSVHHEVH